MTVYYIGGSPCSGKSTVAEALAARYGLTYFKADDFLDDLIAEGAAAGLPVCERIRRMTAEENWMRAPEVQCREELDFYAEVHHLLMQRLNALDAQLVVAEGACLLPQLMHDLGILSRQYIAITPSRDFQVSRYRERPWVPHVLRDCSDRGAAFVNWMARDALFAGEVRRQCARLGYASLLTDGDVCEADRLAQVARHFGLEP